MLATESMSVELISCAEATASIQRANPRLEAFSPVTNEKMLGSDSVVFCLVARTSPTGLKPS